MNSTTTEDRTSASLAALAVFIALVIGMGGLIGAISAPGFWYAGLQKPPLTPQDWALEPIWVALYALIALAGWRIWVVAPHSPAMKFWIAQLLFNWTWLPVFFGSGQPRLALVLLVGMWLSILGFMAFARRHDRLATWLFLPYLAWATFAGYLNLGFAALN